MNKPITLCDRCDIWARCCLDYDGNACRRNRTVEPTNADRIRAMSDEELTKWALHNCHCPPPLNDTFCPYRTDSYRTDHKQTKSCKDCWLEWLQSPEGGNVDES